MIGPDTQARARPTGHQPGPRRHGDVWWVVTWTLRDVALALGLAATVALAWLVLVVARGPQPQVTADAVARQVDEVVADSLLDDRIAAFGNWFVNLAATLVLGGFVFHAFVSRPQDRAGGWSPTRTLRAAAVVGSVASLIALPFRAASLAGSSIAAATDPSTLEFVLTSRVGNSALIRVAGLLVTAFALVDPTHPTDPTDDGGQALVIERTVGAGGALLILASYAWVGHPQATPAPGPLLVLAQSVHVVAVATWFGGVALLFLQIRAGRRTGALRTSAQLVARFSTAAGVSVAATVATGLVLARSQIADLGALTTTPYGRALLAKLAFVGLVLAIGGYNHHWVVPRIVEQGGPAAWRSLHRTLLAETFVLVAAVLLLTTVMTSGGFY